VRFSFVFGQSVDREESSSDRCPLRCTGSSSVSPWWGNFWCDYFLGTPFLKEVLLEFRLVALILIDFPANFSGIPGD
jgi:hypothetical protein